MLRTARNDPKESNNLLPSPENRYCNSTTIGVLMASRASCPVTASGRQEHPLIGTSPGDVKPSQACGGLCWQ
jgi:hypothetical protein